MFTPRTTPVAEGTAPYKWGVDSVYQCTWYCYGRSQEALKTADPPCFWDRATQTGSYTNAKDWLENFRDPWQVKDPSYAPVAGDIAVFDGQYGHVQFMETDVMFSEYSNGDPNSFRNGKFEKKSNLLGFLHYPLNEIPPVERNDKVNQIQTTDPSLRIRTKPSLSGEIVGHVQVGYYNVYNKEENDGYTWYQIAPDRWCADITTNYLPAGGDFVDEIRKWADAMIADLTEKQKKIQSAEADFRQIDEIAKRWIK